MSTIELFTHRTSRTAHGLLPANITSRSSNPYIVARSAHVSALVIRTLRIVTTTILGAVSDVSGKIITVRVTVVTVRDIESR